MFLFVTFCCGHGLKVWKNGNGSGYTQPTVHVFPATSIFILPNVTHITKMLKKHRNCLLFLNNIYWLELFHYSTISRQVYVQSTPSTTPVTVRSAMDNSIATEEQSSTLNRVTQSRGGGWGYSPTFWVGVCRTVLKTPTLFQTKIYDFPYPFSDLTPKIYTPFQTFQTKKAKTIP